MEKERLFLGGRLYPGGVMSGHHVPVAIYELCDTATLAAGVLLHGYC